MRSIRELEYGATYRVESEINRNALELHEPEIKELFLTYINKAKIKYPFQLFDFCITDNYIQLVIKPANGKNLSKIMQWIKGNFAKAWNKMHHMEGHLWGKRFFSKIIHNVQQLFQVIEDIDKNPEKTGMVKRAKDWVFGGLYHHLHGKTDVVEPRSALVKLFFIGKVVADSA
jgi:REP element-mobilizing transposase RayT